MNDGAQQRARATDALGAVGLVEGSLCDRVVTTGADVPLAARNAFGARAVMDLRATADEALARAAECALGGKRVAVVATARELGSARERLEQVAAHRLGIVAHALAGGADAMALLDCGWGILFAGGILEAADLTYVARRAAEDSGTPFLVVHERGDARVTEPVVAPHAALAEQYVGSAAARLKPRNGADAGGRESARRFGERVPFALGSAMRALEQLTNRRHDVFERLPAGDASLVLVGLGRLGEPLLAEIDRLRAAGHDVGALRLTVLRPFPGPRLVKALARALAVTVIEGADHPLAQSNPLTREVKAAFADAITWAPDYPGVGRIPRIVCGVAARELDSADVDAAVENMLADERGKRLFVLGDETEGHALARAVPAPSPTVPLTFRGRVGDADCAARCADVCAAVVASVLGLRVRATVRKLDAAQGGGFAFDIVAGRDRLRGAHVPHALRIIAFDDAAALGRGNPLARLANRGVVAVPTSQRTGESLWAEIPPYARALLHDRKARVVGWSPPAGEGHAALSAAAFAALAVSDGAAEGRATIDAGIVANEVAAVLRHGANPPDDALLQRAAEIARGVFEGSLEVSRAVIDRDDESVRLGRRDARSSAPAR